MATFNDLYASIISSALRLRGELTEPVNAKPNETVVPTDVCSAQKQLQAPQKLHLVLRSKTVSEVPLSTGDSEGTFQKRGNDVCRKWSTTKHYLSINPAAWAISVLVLHGHSFTTALKDTDLLPFRKALASMHKKYLTPSKSLKSILRRSV